MRMFRGQKSPLRGVAFLPDGRRLVVAHKPGIVTCWDLESGSQVASLESRKNSRSGGNRLEAIAVSPDGGLLCAGGDSLTVWDLGTNKTVAGFDVATHLTLRDVMFALNGSRLVAGLQGEWRYTGPSIAIWDTADGREVAIPFPHRGAGKSLALSPDGQSVFVEADYRVIRCHVLTGQEHPTQFESRALLDPLAASSVGVVAHGGYRTVEVRDADGNRLLVRWDAHKKGVSALAFSPDGKLLATGSGDEVVKVWDVSALAGVLADPNAQPLTSMPERGAYEWGLGPVRAVAFSPDGLTAAAVGDRVKFVVWDVE